MPNNTVGSSTNLSNATYHLQRVTVCLSLCARVLEAEYLETVENIATA